MTERTGEGANLYVNDGTGTFEDRSGRVEEWTDVPIDRYTTLTEGTAR